MTQPRNIKQALHSMKDTMLTSTLTNTCTLTDGEYPMLCPNCNTPDDVGLFRQDLPVDHPQFGKLVRCDDPFHSQSRQKRLSQVSQLGPRDVQVRLSDIDRTPRNGKMLDAAERLLQRGYGWLYVWGGPGNAKSEVLKAIVNHCNDSKRSPAVYARLGAIIKHIQAGFADNSSIARLEQLKLAPCLAIDEMDKPRATDWVEEFKFEFLDDRYISAINEQTITVFAGNKDPKHFGPVLYDRIRDGRFEIVQNTEGSGRAGANW